MNTNAALETKNTASLYGEWSSFEALTETEKDIFAVAMKDRVGVVYIPIKVAKQIVNGTNYKCLCESQVVYPGAKESLAIVDIYDPIEGLPVLTKISNTVRETETDCDMIPGGWSPWKFVTPDVRAVFDEATKGLLGVDYLPLEFSTQVVEGMNYRFICEAKMIFPDDRSYIVIMEIYKPQGGRNATVTSIERIG